MKKSTEGGEYNDPSVWMFSKPSKLVLVKNEEKLQFYHNHCHLGCLDHAEKMDHAKKTSLENCLQYNIENRVCFTFSPSKAFDIFISFTSKSRKDKDR